MLEFSSPTILTIVLADFISMEYQVKSVKFLDFILT